MTNAKLTEKETADFFHQMAKTVSVALHNIAKQEFNKHIPYAEIKKTFRKGVVKCVRRDSLQLNTKKLLGLNPAEETTAEENSNHQEWIINYTIKTLNKKYKISMETIKFGVDK